MSTDPSDKLRQLGENQSLKKADEWRRLLVVTPVILWFSWKDDNGKIPDSEPPVSANENITTTHSRNRKSLYDVILLLCVGVRKLSTKRISMAQANEGQSYLAFYCQRLLALGVELTINHHLSMHFASMIKLFGPVYSWWLFPFERFNGMLEKVNLNGHDGGRMELTMLRYWVQTHLLYERLLDLPESASEQERTFLERFVQAEASQQRGGMMTQIAILRAEAMSERVSLPKRIGRPIALQGIILPQAALYGQDTYGLLLEYARRLWPNLHIRRQFMDDGDGPAFIQDKVASRIPYVRKDGLRYGSMGNTRTQADCFAFIVRDDVRVPIRIEHLFLLKVPNTIHPAHACAIIRRLETDTVLPFNLPWAL